MCKCFQIPDPSPRVASTPIEQKPTTIGLIIYRHFTRTKLRHLARGRSERKLSNPCINKRKSCTNLPSSFCLINTRKKDKTLDSHSVLITLRSTTSGTKWRTHVLGRSGCVTNCPIKAGLRDSSPALRDFSWSNKHCIHLSITKTIYFSRFVFSNACICTNRGFLF